MYQLSLGEEELVPSNTNVISSHVVYRIKENEDGSRKLKARLVPHGNRDVERNSIRKDSSIAQFEVIRFLLFTVTPLGFWFSMADIQGAYLQSGPITREIYVRPPKEWNGNRGIQWKLMKLPYRIVETSRQRATTIANWMLFAGGLMKVYGINQIYIRRNGRGHIKLALYG